MNPATVQIPSHKRGDDWEGMTVGPISPAPASPCASCRLHFRKSGSDTLGFALSNAPSATEGTIQIVNAATYQFNFPSQKLNLKDGSWDWDFETTAVSGRVSTWLQGTLVVSKDHSHG